MKLSDLKDKKNSLLLALEEVNKQITTTSLRDWNDSLQPDFQEAQSRVGYYRNGSCFYHLHSPEKTKDGVIMKVDTITVQHAKSTHPVFTFSVHSHERVPLTYARNYVAITQLSKKYFEELKDKAAQIIKMLQ